MRQTSIFLSLIPACFAILGTAEALLLVQLGPPIWAEFGEDRAYSCVVYRSPLGAPARPLHFSDYKRLVGKMIFRFRPPDGLSDMQKTEWLIGCTTGAAEICGYYSKAAKVRAFMSRSPYFKKGRSHILGFDLVENCGGISTTLGEVLEDKVEWETYLEAVYPAQ